MATIKIIAGTFGWNHGNYDLVSAGDPPIEVDAALAARLVEKGVAEYVTPPVKAPEPVEPEPVERNIPAYSEENSAKYLRELGKEHGLNFKANATKAEMLAALDELFGVGDDPEDAPTFDAAEAVQ